jgi:glutamine cyclotransferase
MADARHRLVALTTALSLAVAACASTEPRATPGPTDAAAPTSSLTTEVSVAPSSTASPGAAPAPTSPGAAPAPTSPGAAPAPTTTAAARPTTTLAGPGGAPATSRLRVEVLERRPHDPRAFTQGLVLDGGTLFESTGQYGESTVREVDARTGVVRRQRSIGAELFGEGLALVDGELIQITWREGVALVHGRDDLKERRRIRYDGEGWGLCDDGARLVMSDGTDQLTFRDRRTFAAIGRVAVRRDGVPVRLLNELECVGGMVWANVWQTDTIVRIDPASGAVTGTVDASGLLAAGERNRADVLNGIAFDPSRGTFLITGKWWPALFEVRFVAA